MASYVDRMLEGVTSDLSGLGKTSIPLAAEYSSLLFQAVTAAVKAYQTAELTEEDEKRKTELLSELKTAAADQKAAEKAAEKEAGEAAIALVGKTAAADILQKTAELNAQLAEKLAAIRREYAEKTADQTAELAVLNDKKTAAAIAAVKEVLKAKTAKKKTGKTRAKLAANYWYVNGLLKTASQAGSFFFSPEDRRVWYYPTGKDVGKLPYMRIEKAAWRYVGQYVDHKRTNSLTGIVRWAYAFTNAAEKAAEPEDALTSANGQAVNGWLEEDCGGVVTAFPVGEDGKLLECDRGKPEDAKPLAAFPLAELKKTAEKNAADQTAADQKAAAARAKKAAAEKKAA